MRQVNSWTGPIPSAPKDLNSRGVTRGAYSGLGEVYDVAIPAGTIVAGTNTVRRNSFLSSSYRADNRNRLPLVSSLAAPETRSSVLTL